MKLLIVLISIVVFTSIASANQEMNNDTKFKLYSAESKNPWLAVGAAWLVPTLGHAYAEDWERSLPFFGAEVASFVLMASGVNTNDTTTAGLGLGIFVIARIWEYMDAYGTAEEFNINLKKKYGLTFIIREDLPTLAFNCKF